MEGPTYARRSPGGTGCDGQLLHGGARDDPLQKHDTRE